MKKIHLATISILIKDRHNQSKDINKILSEYGNLILSRLGLNLQPKCASNCTALITIVVQGPAKEIRDLSEKLDKIYGVVAKKSILTQ